MDQTHCDPPPSRLFVHIEQITLRSRVFEPSLAAYKFIHARLRILPLLIQLVDLLVVLFFADLVLPPI